MKIAWVALCLGIIWTCSTAQADVILGSIGIESDTPIAGEEDVIIYNDTGSLFGCSTPGGTPICTPVTFEDAVLTINGTSLLDLGNISPGFVETLTFQGGVFVDGTINSLSLKTSISPTGLVDDLNNEFSVESDISLSDIPTDGSLTLISANVVGTPEPNTLLLLLPLLALLKNRAKCLR